MSIVLAPRWNGYTSKYQMVIIAGLAKRVFSAASSSPSAIANHIHSIDFKPLKCLHLSAARKTPRAHFTAKALYFLCQRIHHAYVSSSGRHALTPFFRWVIFHRCRRRRKHDRILLAARDFLFRLNLQFVSFAMTQHVCCVAERETRYFHFLLKCLFIMDSFFSLPVFHHPH